MFNGEEHVRFRSALTGGTLEDEIERFLGPVGRVRFRRRGLFDLAPLAWETALVRVRISGRLSKHKKRSGEFDWVVSVDFSVAPSGLGWGLIALFTVLLFPLGPLGLLIPNAAKNDLGRAVRAMLLELRDDVAA